MELPKPVGLVQQHGLRVRQKLRYKPRRKRLPPATKNVELILIKVFRFVGGLLVQEVFPEETVLLDCQSDRVSFRVRKWARLNSIPRDDLLFLLITIIIN